MYKFANFCLFKKMLNAAFKYTTTFILFLFLFIKVIFYRLDYMLIKIIGKVHLLKKL